jgi:Zn-dependent peptidase ImmA (M78 family)
LAHELGHILLCERYGWNPLTGSEYYKCEDCCDRFAAHLLVPEAAMEAMTFSTAKDAFTAVSQLSQIYSVSLEVASRRIVERIKHVGFFQAQEKTNSKQQPVLALDWGASSIAHLRLTPGLYLNEAHPLGGVVLLQRKKPCDEEVLVTEFGTACGRFRNNRWFLALRER